MWFVPNVFVALLILVFGAYFAKFVGDAVTTYGRNAGMQDALLLGKVAQYAILLFVVLIALDQIKVGGDIVRQSFLIILGGVVFALALAFGLAGKDWAAERIEEWWPQRPPAAPQARGRVAPEPRASEPPAARPPAADRVAARGTDRRTGRIRDEAHATLRSTPSGRAARTRSARPGTARA